MIIDEPASDCSLNGGVARPDLFLSLSPCQIARGHAIWVPRWAELRVIPRVNDDVDF